MPAISGITSRIVEIPLRRPFATAQDRLARQVSRPVYVRMALDDGTAFEGEAVPVAYVTGETQETVIAAIASAEAMLVGTPVERWRLCVDRIGEALGSAPSARAAMEMALFRAVAHGQRVSPWRWFGGATRSIESDVTLSLTDDYLEHAREAARAGIGRIKVKVGSADPADDLHRLTEIHRVAPGAALRVDANQAFHRPDDAVRFIASVLDAGLNLEIVEQPTPKSDLDALDTVAAAYPDLVFADEAVRSPADALAIAARTRVRGINIKLMKAGVAGALDIIAIAQTAGIRLMIGCMLETRRSMGFTLALACGTGAFTFADLDGHLLLDEPGPNQEFAQSGGTLTVTVDA